MSALPLTLTLPNITVESYLTGKARAQLKNALIVRVDDANETRYLLQLPDHSDITLGIEFHASRRALYALLDYYKATGKLPG